MMRLFSIVFGAICMMIVSSQQAFAVGDKKQPNILWIYVEDMNDWMGAYGDNTVPTPNIDAIANGGVRFNTAIMPAPVCSSTRSAIINGVMPTSIGVHNHRSSRGPSDAIYIPKGHKTIPELFQDHGYETFNIGKDDYNFIYDRGKIYTIDPTTPKIIKKRTAARVNGKAGMKFPLSDLPKDKPFFGQIQLHGGKDKGKTPIKVAPQSVKDKLPPYYPQHKTFLKAWARHYEQIAITDKKVGNIIKELKDNGLYENTILFFFTDHGMVLPRHKQFNYEGGLQVPLVINWPNAPKNLQTHGKVRDDIVNGIDIGTSSLALAGIEIPAYMEGDDLFAADYKEKEYTISARDRLDYTFDRIRSVRGVRFKYIRNYFPERPYMQPQYRDLHPKKFPFMGALKKLYADGQLNKVQAAFMAKTRPAEELYDLDNDPHEINNLARDPKYKAQLIKYRTILENWVKKSDDKGQYPESDAGIADVISHWGDTCVSPECVNYRKRKGQK